MLYRVRLLETPLTEACQAPLSMGFPRQEYWSGLPFPSPEDLPDPEIEPAALAFPALAGRFFTTAPAGNLHFVESGPAGSEQGHGNCASLA